MSDVIQLVPYTPKETDIAVRTYLPARRKKGDMSKFIERGSEEEVLRARYIGTFKQRNAELPRR